MSDISVPDSGPDPSLARRRVLLTFALLAAAVVAFVAQRYAMLPSSAVVASRAARVLSAPGSITHLSLSGETAQSGRDRRVWREEVWLDPAHELTKWVHSSADADDDLLVVSVARSGHTVAMERHDGRMQVFESDAPGQMRDVAAFDATEYSHVLEDARVVRRDMVGGVSAYVLETDRRDASGKQRQWTLSVSARGMRPLRLVYEESVARGRQTVTTEHTDIRFRSVEHLGEADEDLFSLSGGSGADAEGVTMLPAEAAHDVGGLELYYLGAAFSGLRWDGEFEYRSAGTPGDGDRTSASTRYVDSDGVPRLRLTVLPLIPHADWRVFTATSRFDRLTVRRMPALLSEDTASATLVVNVGQATLLLEAADRDVLLKAVEALRRL